MSACACAATFLIAGCTQDKVVPATEVLVVVNSDLEIGTQLTRVRVQVQSKAGDTASTSRELDLALVPQAEGTANATVPYELPLSFSVVPQKSEADSRFRIVVTGVLDDQAVVEQQVVITFQAGKTVLLPVFLSINCFGRLCRDEQREGHDVVCAARSGSCASVPTAKNLKAVDPKTSAVKLAQQGASGSVPPLPDDDDDDGGALPMSEDGSDSGTPQAACATSCGDKMCCYLGCVDPMTDNDNCGGCNRVCPERSTCKAGVCMCSKVTDNVCDKQCTDVVADNMNCGLCGMTCKSPTQCMAGACKCPKGAGGDTVCGDVCVDTRNDSKNCGTCGMKCKGPTTCDLGSCACPYGETVCADACVDTQTDNDHCGDCDTVCDGETSCVLGRCKCPDFGLSACDGTCVQLSSDVNNCGACGNKCSGSEVCCTGRCVDTTSDPNNCSTCGMKCSTTTDTCAMGACKCGTANACVANFLGLGGTCNNGSCN